MSGRINFKLDFGGETHRFASTLAGDDLFTVVKAKVASVVGDELFEMYWIDDASHVFISCSDDLQAAIDYARFTKKNSAKSPRVLLVAAAVKRICGVTATTPAFQPASTVAVETAREEERGRCKTTSSSEKDKMRALQQQSKLAEQMEEMPLTQLMQNMLRASTQDNEEEGIPSALAAQKAREALLQTIGLPSTSDPYLSALLDVALLDDAVDLSLKKDAERKATNALAVRMLLKANVQGDTPIPVVNSKTKERGEGAPLLKNIETWLAAHPDYTIDLPGASSPPSTGDSEAETVTKQFVRDAATAPTPVKAFVAPVTAPAAEIPASEQRTEQPSRRAFGYMTDSEKNATSTAYQQETDRFFEPSYVIPSAVEIASPSTELESADRQIAQVIDQIYASSNYTPIPKRKRQLRNPVWPYFIVEDGVAKCKQCAYSTKSVFSTNLKVHLRTHHRSEYEKVIEAEDLNALLLSGNAAADLAGEDDGKRSLPAEMPATEAKTNELINQLLDRYMVEEGRTSPAYQQETSRLIEQVLDSYFVDFDQAAKTVATADVAAPVSAPSDIESDDRQITQVVEQICEISNCEPASDGEIAQALEQSTLSNSDQEAESLPDDRKIAQIRDRFYATGSGQTIRQILGDEIVSQVITLSAKHPDLSAGDIRERLLSSGVCDQESLPEISTIRHVLKRIEKANQDAKKAQDELNRIQEVSQKVTATAAEAVACDSQRDVVDSSPVTEEQVMYSIETAEGGLDSGVTHDDEDGEMVEVSATEASFEDDVEVQEDRSDEDSWTIDNAPVVASVAAEIVQLQPTALQQLEAREAALAEKEASFERRIASFAVEIEEFEERIRLLEKRVGKVEKGKDGEMEKRMDEVEERQSKIEM